MKGAGVCALYTSCGVGLLCKVYDYIRLRLQFADSSTLRVFHYDTKFGFWPRKSKSFVWVPNGINSIGVRSQSTLGCTTFLPEKYVSKINKVPEFYMIPARKIIKIPEFLLYLPEKLKKFPNFTWLLPENARILHNNCPEIFFPIFLGRGCTWWKSRQYNTIFKTWR